MKTIYNIYDLQKWFIESIGSPDDYIELLCMDKKGKMYSLKWRQNAPPDKSKYHDDLVVWHKGSIAFFIRNNDSNKTRYSSYEEIVVDSNSIEETIKQNSGILFCLRLNQCRKKESKGCVILESVKSKLEKIESKVTLNDRVELSQSAFHLSIAVHDLRSFIIFLQRYLILGKTPNIREYFSLFSYALSQIEGARNELRNGLGKSENSP